jgi:hypothetical protein
MNNNITSNFPISNEEYLNLEKSFGNLCKYASWQLLRKNAKNNHTDDFEDINQELIMSLIRAGSYYKRQIYIERCFEVAKRHIKDVFMCKVLEGLEDLWRNRTRHGANRQKYGMQQERLLYAIVNKVVPLKERPKKNAPLKIDTKFSTYCKAIAWNAQKSLGRKITKEKSIRSGIASLSDFDYLGSGE